MTVYIANSFTLSMLKPEQLSEGVTIQVKKLALHEVKEMLTSGFVSCIGHSSTSQFVSQLLEMNIPMNRIQIKMEKDDQLIVVQILKRLEEGKILDQEEIERMYKNGEVDFFLVEIV